MVYVIAEPCLDVKDRSCVDVCPVDCIYEGDRRLYIHPDECIDCGACAVTCPVEAIHRDDELPVRWADYVRINAEFFDGVGAPNGAAGFGPIGRDHPEVEASRRR